MGVVAKRLIIGTSNMAKFDQVRAALSPTGLRCVGVADVLGQMPPVPEEGATAAEVAENKALAYSAATGECVLAMDYWLQFEGVEHEEQPGAYVRRIPGHPDGADDATMLDYYSTLSMRHGGALMGRWTLGVAVAGPSGVRSTTRTGRDRLFVDVPSTTWQPGLPLTALQVDPATGRYMSEHSQEEEERMWQEVYGVALAPFVSDAMKTVTRQ